MRKVQYSAAKKYLLQQHREDVAAILPAKLENHGQSISDASPFSSYKIILYNLSFLIFLSSVLIAPLFLGALANWSWAMMGIGISISTILLILSGQTQFLQRRRIKALIFPLGCILIVLCWMFGQQLTVVNITDNFSGLAAEALHQKLPMSANPFETLLGIKRFIGYILVFLLAYYFAAQKQQARLMLRAVFIACILYSAYGIWQLFVDSNMLLGFHRPEYGGMLSGTLISKNHFATLAAMGFFCGFWLLLEQKTSKSYGKIFKLEKLRNFLKKGIFDALGCCFLGLALILTQSRAGFGSAAIVLVFSLLLAWKLGFFSLRSLVKTCVITLMIATVIYYLGGTGMNERFDNYLNHNPRADVMNVTFSMIAAFPLTGGGFGGFAELYKLFRPEGMTALYLDAHNIFLENIAELGIPAATLLFISIGWCGWRCFIGALKRKRSKNIPAAAFSVLLMVIFHGFFDSSLKIPAITGIFLLIMAVGTAQSFNSRELGK
ncbi:MAG: O-antigen ligase family protein [Alphaproteobacteria bacterium]